MYFSKWPKDKNTLTPNLVTLGRAMYTRSRTMNFNLMGFGKTALSSMALSMERQIFVRNNGSMYKTGLKIPEK
jgi:hypothetical protein